MMTNNFSGLYAIEQDHPALKGVKRLFAASGNPVADIDPESPANQVAVTNPQGKFMLAWFDAQVSSRRYTAEPPVPAKK